MSHLVWGLFHLTGVSYLVWGLFHLTGVSYVQGVCFILSGTVCFTMLTIKIDNLLEGVSNDIRYDRGCW